jgi:hypothetical protein
MDRNLIKSVLGFNLKIDIRDESGRIIPTGVRKTFYPIDIATRVNTTILDKRFFTTFDEALLAKIRDHKRLND